MLLCISVFLYFRISVFSYFILEGLVMGRGCSSRPGVFHTQCDSHVGSDHKGNISKEIKYSYSIILRKI